MLYLAMLIDAIWYDWTEERPQDQDSFKIGSLLAFSATQVIVGFMAQLATIPVAILLTFLFRRSQKRIKREDRVKKVAKNEEENWSRNGANEEETEDEGIQG